MHGCAEVIPVVRQAAAAKTSSPASEPECAAEIHELSLRCARARGRVEIRAASRRRTFALNVASSSAVAPAAAGTQRHTLSKQTPKKEHDER